jgi:hypothetical protein
MEFLCLILSDDVILPLFELVFLGLFIFAILRDRGWFVTKGGLVTEVIRGEKSWNMFYLAIGIASVVMMQVINSADALKGYKTIISILNLGMLLYLAFFNSWFRNQTVGFIAKSQEKKERL